MRRILPVSVIAVLLCARVFATEYPAPDRPLRPGEDLSLSVAESGAIVLGQVLSSYDTTVARSAGGDVGHLQVTWLRVEQSVKGSLRPGELRVVQWPQRPGAEAASKAGDRGQVRVGDPAHRVIVLLSDLAARPPAPPDSYLGAAQGISHWATSEESSPYAIAGLQDWSTEIETQVRRELSRQGPEAMTRASDRVVFASFDTAQGVASTVPFGDRIRIEHTFKGPPASTPLKIRFVVPTEDPGHLAFLFLKQVGKDLYEPTILRAGVVPIVGDQVPFWGISVKRASSRIDGATYRAH